MITLLISLVSVIVGILLTHALTRSWQMNQWILEQRKLEGRELITAITEHYDMILHLASLKILDIPVKAEDKQLLDDARRSVLRKLHDRIYLATDVKQANLLKRWIDAFNAFKDNNDSDGVDAFVNEYNSICDIIVKAAMRGTMRSMSRF